MRPGYVTMMMEDVEMGGLAQISQIIPAVQIQNSLKS